MPPMVLGIGIGVVFDNTTGAGAGGDTFRILQENNSRLLTESGDYLRKEQNS